MTVLRLFRRSQLALLVALCKIFDPRLYFRLRFELQHSAGRLRSETVTQGTHNVFQY